MPQKLVTNKYPPLPTNLAFEYINLAIKYYCYEKYTSFFSRIA